MSTLRANKIVGKSNQPVNIPGSISNASCAYNSLRMSTGTVNNFNYDMGSGLVWNFFKEWDDSTLIIDMVVPGWGNTNDGTYQWLTVNSIPYKVGVSPCSQGNNAASQGFRILTPIFGINEKYTDHNWSVTYNEPFRGITGVGRGPVVILFGWSPEDNSANRDVNVINANRHDDTRNQQTGATVVCWEIPGNASSGGSAVDIINYDIG
jgi:hypothetical protein